MSDSAFVSTMAELQRLQEDTTLDSARLAAARQATLQRRGLTATAVEQAARALAGDPERAGKLWEAIQRQVRGDSVPPPSAGGPPVLGPHRSP